MKDKEDKISDVSEHGPKEKREIVLTVSLSTIKRIIKWLRKRL